MEGGCAGGLVDACFVCLGQLMRPSHGSARDTSARVLRNLTPALLGVAGPHGVSSIAPGAAHGPQAASATQMLRNRTLQFANDALR